MIVHPLAGAPDGYGPDLECPFASALRRAGGAVPRRRARWATLAPDARQEPGLVGGERPGG